MRRVVLFALTFLVALGLVPLRAEAKGVCIVGVSKNLCGGAMSGGNWPALQCNGPNGVHCSTLMGIGTGFASPVKTAGPPCDEAKELDGNLRTTINVNLRQNPILLQEGSFGGKFDLIQAGGIVASGTINATLGVGTHHVACGGTCGKNCERCYFASFDTTQKIWTIHSEGFMDGQVNVGVYKGCHIRWSFKGEFKAKGKPAGPTPPGEGWKFCGNVDGVLECPCG
jgi:hypothetical protein